MTMKKTWKKQELTYLKRYAAKRTLAELAKRFKTRPPTVQKQLERMGLAAVDSPKTPEPEPDPVLETYEKALASLQAGRKAEAEKLFNRVAAETDQIDLAERARRYAKICRQRRRKRKKEELDPYLEAVLAVNRDELDEALSICTRGGRYSKDDRFAHLAAAIHARRGDLEEAVKYLTVAIELNPANRVHAYHDPDFEELRKEPEYAELFQPD